MGVGNNVLTWDRQVATRPWYLSTELLHGRQLWISSCPWRLEHWSGYLNREIPQIRRHLGTPPSCTPRTAGPMRILWSMGMVLRSRSPIFFWDFSLTGRQDVEIFRSVTRVGPGRTLSLTTQPLAATVKVPGMFCKLWSLQRYFGSWCCAPPRQSLTPNGSKKVCIQIARWAFQQACATWGHISLYLFLNFQHDI